MAAKHTLVVFFVLLTFLLLGGTPSFAQGTTDPQDPLLSPEGAAGLGRGFDPTTHLCIDGEVVASGPSQPPPLVDPGPPPTQLLPARGAGLQIAYPSDVEPTGSFDEFQPGVVEEVEP